MRSDEKLTAFVELERAIHEFAVDLKLQHSETPLTRERFIVRADEKLIAFLELESAVPGTRSRVSGEVLYKN